MLKKYWYRRSFNAALLELGIEPTELNPDFRDEVLALAMREQLTPKEAAPWWTGWAASTWCASGAAARRSARPTTSEHKAPAWPSHKHPRFASGSARAWVIPAECNALPLPNTPIAP